MRRRFLNGAVMLSLDGFLAPGMASTVEGIRREHAAWFDALGVANRLAMEILPELKPGRQDNQKVLEAAFYAKALQSIQAVALLVERGMIGDARTILRTCVEGAILQRKVADDPTFVARLIERHDYHRRSLGTGVLNNAQLAAELRPDDLSRIKATAAEISARYPNAKPRDINLAEVAASVNGMHLYTLFFKPLSGDSAHGTIDALERHITSDSKGHMTGLAFGPQPVGVADTLSASLSVLFHVLDTAIERFALAQFRPRLAECLTNWKAMAAPE